MTGSEQEKPRLTPPPIKWDSRVNTKPIVPTFVRSEHLQHKPFKAGLQPLKKEGKQ